MSTYDRNSIPQETACIRFNFYLMHSHTTVCVCQCISGCIMWCIVLFGEGAGKTMLMDLFYKRAQVARKRRVHFNSFMLDIHDSMHHHYWADTQKLPPSPLPPSPSPSLSLSLTHTHTHTHTLLMQGFTSSRGVSLGRLLERNLMHMTLLPQWPEMWPLTATFSALTNFR